MIKTQDNFDGYSLSNLYNNLKADENEAKDIAEENKSSLGGPLALVSIDFGNDIESNEDAKYGEEGFMFNSNDKAFAYYSNNKVNKFFKKPFSGKIKNGYVSKAMSKYGKGVKEGSKFQKLKRKRLRIEVRRRKR